MDIDALRTVALVAQQGSFASAARVLGMDPSSVSRAVANVEASLGLRLFQRNTRVLRITEEGDIYLRRIRPLLDELDHAREEASHVRSTPSGVLKFTASVAFAHECIVPHLGAFGRLFPEITVELLPSDATLDIAAEGIDLAVRLATAPEGDLVTTRLLRTRYLVCASPDYVAQAGMPADPRALSDLDCLRFALPAYRTRWRFRTSGEELIDVPVRGRLVISNALSLREAAREGLGPALLADWLVARDLEAGRLVSLFPDYECTATSFDTGAWALYPSRSYLPRKVRVMIDFLRARLAVPSY